MRGPEGPEFAFPLEAVVRTADPNVVLLQFTAPNGCIGPRSYELNETSDWVTAAVYVTDGTVEDPRLLCTLALQSFLIEVRLRTPLGERPVYDVGVKVLVGHR
jgi:hypothetical protein